VRWPHFVTSSKTLENMAKKQSAIAIPEEIIMSKIYEIRGEKIMIDRDLAELYQVETKRLKEAVRRNINRFPEDFMFEMTKDEFENWRTQFATSKSEKMGLRYAPFCFTEQGVTMLSCVLSSDRAIAVNIQIVRLFTKMRKLILTHKDILAELEKIKQRLGTNSNDIGLIFEYLKQFEAAKQQELEYQNREPIGFKPKKKDK